MKRTINSVIAAAVLAICLTGCEKEIFSSFSEIKFKAETVSDPDTKTEYGKRVGGVQMVDWRAGDLVRITSAQAAQDTMSGTIHYADYVVQSNGTQDGSSARSVSRISAQNRGLHWGSKDSTHIFYSVYPSPGTRGKSSDDLDEYGAMRGNIPATQTPLSVSSSAPYVAAPDMIHQYMVAKRTVSAGTQTIADNEVFLYYTPITTAIEFEVTNGMTDNLTIASIDLISASHNLSGTFTCSLKGLNESGGTYPVVTAASGASKAASVSFGTSGVVLADNQKLTFTIFLLPEDNLNDLTFRINKTDGKYIQADLRSDASGNPFITFARCKKHFVKGLFVNEGAQWTVCFAPGVSSWIESGAAKDLDDPAAAGSPYLASWDQGGESGHLNLGKPLEYKFSLATGVSDTQTFNPAASDWNVKTLGISSTKDSESEGWVNEPQGWKIKTVGGKAVTGNSYTTSDGLLTVEKDGNNLKVTDNRQKISYGDNAHWTTSGTDWYRAPLSGTIDLSKRDFRTGNTISMTTANCYVVRNAGTYKIPLVYGNAVFNGNTNSDSYAPTIASGGSNGLTPFQHHLGKNIVSPYIENNTDDGETKWYKEAYKYKGTNYPESYNNYLSAKSASVVWQDNGTVIKSVSITPTSTLSRDKTDTDATADTKYTANNVRYIQFTISQDDIRQCNAVIAVKDASNNIMWSWHIWVTNDPVLDNGPVTVNSTYKFLPSPCIGWIEPSFYEKKDDVTIVLEQEDSGETLTVTVKQPATDPDQGKGTYYQWGRKDPMRASSGATGTGPTAIVNGILNPGAFVLTNGNWCSSTYDNLWTGKYSQAPSSAVGEVTGMIKTVYDPSPAGYKVPAPNAFAGIDNGESSEITLVEVGYCDRSKGYWGDYISGYWTSVAKSTNAFCYAFPLRGSVATYLTNKNRSEGLAVRPVQE